MTTRQLIMANWKMNGVQAMRAAAQQVADNTAPDGAEVVICPPATLVTDIARDLAGAPVAVGGQDCHAAEAGPHTGDVSAAMLADAGAQYVILGHSELRSQGVRSDAVRQSAAAAIHAGLTAVVCVGETAEQHDEGWHQNRVRGQLYISLPNLTAFDPNRLVIAYEPIWAIGTGKTPTGEDIRAMHAAIRTTVIDLFGPAAAGVRILYGGSVKPGNAGDILALDGVDGALVGGASLDPADFLAIAGFGRGAQP